MSFRPMLRPGQGFKTFKILRRVGGVTESGRPTTSSLKHQGEFIGILSKASPEDKEQFKQKGSPITHTIVQRGTAHRAQAEDVLELAEEGCKARRFLVKKDPRNPGDLGFFLVYHVQERDDLK